MDRSDVVAAVSELAGERLVERAVDQADRRRNVVTMTAAGAARLERLDRVLADVQDELLAPLAPAERVELRRLLTLMLD